MACRYAFSLSALMLGVLPVLGLGAASCYSTGDGAAPPVRQIYYPVGLQVSAGGTVLYAVNSDFDLQYNGGVLQSYDLALICRHAVALIADPRDPNVTSILDRDKVANNPCPARASSLPTPGETCAPPVDSAFYVRDTAVIGAFATDLVLSRPPASLEITSPSLSNEETVCAPTAANRPKDCPPPLGTRGFDRLFAPVRGNASLTWASVQRDSLTSSAPADPTIPYGPFTIQCGKDSSGRCDGAHSAGTNPDELGNSRHITMPGEPFGMAVSPDGESIIVTHQNETKASLFSTGLSRVQDDSGAGDNAPAPFLQFVLDGLPFGGVGAAAIPHARDAFLGISAAFPRPAFLETSRSAGQVSLLRQYPDEFDGASSIRRPFLDLEAGFPITIGAGGTDSRGIVIDQSPRIACRAKVLVNPAKGRTQDVIDGELRACARKPARAFIANRSPASLLVGEIGGSANANDDFDPDRLVIHTTIPLSAGPSKLYLAPVVERDGAYALRVFAVCFDSATVFVYDPEAEQIENVIRVGLGPFAMAFDPFDPVAVATHAKAPIDTRHPETPNLKTYRFAYLASFTNSFIQLLDLDNDQGNATFERVVFTLGRPTTPKGS